MARQPLCAGEVDKPIFIFMRCEMITRHTAVCSKPQHPIGRTTDRAYAVVYQSVSRCEIDEPFPVIRRDTPVGAKPHPSIRCVVNDSHGIVD